MEIQNIAIEGGPCAGKTTILSKFIECMQQTGHFPLVVPETASLLFLMGLNPRDMGNIPFQRAIVEMQLQNESFAKRYASAIGERLNKKPVIFSDRGLLGGAGYIGESINALESFEQQVLKGLDLSVEGVRAEYTGVIYMDSAAVGAEEYYTLSNNEARTETVDQARTLNENGKKIWLGHPHLCVIPNINTQGEKVTFEQKIQHATEELYRILGIPIPVEIEDKYLIGNFKPHDVPVPYEVINIDQQYLIHKQHGIEERVRKRTWLDSSSYFHTIKSPGPNGGRFETERHISKKEYQTLLLRRNQTKNVIQKRRFCFLWNNQYFEVDIFLGKLSGLQLMEIEHTLLNTVTDLPPFITVLKKVTDDAKYKNSNLATLGSIKVI